jgi:hypothetical protein
LREIEAAAGIGLYSPLGSIVRIRDGNIRSGHCITGWIGDASHYGACGFALSKKERRIEELQESEH